MQTHRIQIFIFCTLMIIGVFFGYLNAKNISLSDFFSSNVPILHIGEVPVHVEIAASQAERIKGLSGRESLENVEGLLFLFPETGMHGIWMKDMRFPIDILWIDENLVIVDIEKNVHPDSYPKVFRPEKAAKYVLETNVHFADTFNIVEGQKVSLPEEILE